MAKRLQPQQPDDAVQVIAKTRLFKSAEETYVEAGETTTLDPKTASELHALGFVEYVNPISEAEEISNEE